MNPSSQIYFICGADNLKEITTWREYQYIMEHYFLLVIRRNLDDLGNFHFQDNCHIIITDLVAKAISSTEIREYLKTKNTKKLATAVDENVLEYIKENNIYGG